MVIVAEADSKRTRLFVSCLPIERFRVWPFFAYRVYQTISNNFMMMPEVAIARRNHRLESVSWSVMIMGVSMMLEVFYRF